MGRILASLLCLVGVALASCPAVADNPVYQVEILVFSQADHYQREITPLNVALGYPDKMVFLDGNRTELPADFNKLSSRDQALYRLLIPQSLLTREPEKPLDFYLPVVETQRQLNPEAYTLRRSGDYKVLFHQSWFQPLPVKNQASWIFISGGPQLAGYGELEGSVRFYKNRFLHFEANLWRSQFASLPVSDPAVEEASQEESLSTWPPLPQPPARPKPELPPFLKAAPREFILSTENMGAYPTPNGQPQEPLPQDNGLGTSDVIAPAIGALDVIQQSLRIDDTSVHYVDHPRLGILLRVKEYQPDTIDETEALTD